MAVPRLGGREGAAYYLINAKAPFVQDNKFTNGEIQEAVFKFKQIFRPKITEMYELTAKIIMEDLLHIDEYKDDITKLIYNLVRGEVMKRIKHATSKITKYIFTKTESLVRHKFDYDEIIYDHHLNLLGSLERFFDIEDLRFPFKKLPNYKSGIHEMWQWYPCLNDEIYTFLQSTITSLTEKRDICATMPIYQKPIEKEIQRLQVMQDLNKENSSFLNEAIHILETRKSYNNIEKLFIQISFPKQLQNLNSRIMSHILRHNSLYRAQDCTLTIWCQMARIMRCKSYAWDNLGISEADEDDKKGKQKYLMSLRKEKILKEQGWKSFYSDDIEMDLDYKCYPPRNCNNVNYSLIYDEPTVIKDNTIKVNLKTHVTSQARVSPNFSV